METESEYCRMIRNQRKCERLMISKTNKQANLTWSKSCIKASNREGRVQKWLAFSWRFISIHVQCVTLWYQNAISSAGSMISLDVWVISGNRMTRRPSSAILIISVNYVRFTSKTRRLQDYKLRELSPRGELSSSAFMTNQLEHISTHTFSWSILIVQSVRSFGY